MTKLELIETLPLEQLLPLQEIIERRLLAAEEKVDHESHLTIIPTVEQSAELERLMEANRKGELEMISGEEFLNRLRKRLDL